MKKLFMLFCLLVLFSVGPLFDDSMGLLAQTNEVDKLPTEYYTFEQVYQMLLFEISEPELFASLPSDLQFLLAIKTTKKELADMTVSAEMANSATRFAKQMRGRFAEPYVVQGIDEFAKYLQSSIGKNLSQIDREARKSSIASLNQPQENSNNAVPSELYLLGNYPNPFNPTTMIQYALPCDCFVRLTVFNILGEKVATLVNEKQTAGIKSVEWDGKNSQDQFVSSGIYFYQVKTNSSALVGKMILAK